MEDLFADNLPDELDVFWCRVDEFHAVRSGVDGFVIGTFDSGKKLSDPVVLGPAAVPTTLLCPPLFHLKQIRTQWSSSKHFFWPPILSLQFTVNLYWEEIKDLIFEHNVFWKKKHNRPLTIFQIPMIRQEQVLQVWKQDLTLLNCNSHFIPTYCFEKFVTKY